MLREADEARRGTKEDFEEELGKYLDKQFAESTVHFDRVAQADPSDVAAVIYRKRAADFMVAGVPDDWDG